MKYCRECGNPVEEGNKFCKNCGTEIIENTQNTQPQFTVKQDQIPNTQESSFNNKKLNIEKINTTPSQIPQKKSKAKIYLAVMIIVLVLLVGAGIVLSSLAPTEAVYEGQYFSFNHPTNYVIEAESNSTNLEDITIFTGEGEYVGSIYIWKSSSEISLDEDLQIMEDSDFTNVDVGYVNFAGFSNVIKETGRYSDGDNYIGYLIQENGYTLQISLASDVDGVNMILNSFKASI